VANRNPRQRIRKEETRFRGDGESTSHKIDEHSVFFDDGSIASKEYEEIQVLQGIIPHHREDIAGQCQSCLDFTTKLIICDHCWQAVCLHCAIKRENKIVCPACFRYLEHRRWILILKKLFIEPFVERIR